MKGSDMFPVFRYRLDVDPDTVDRLPTDDPDRAAEDEDTVPLSHAGSIDTDTIDPRGDL